VSDYRETEYQSERDTNRDKREARDKSYRPRDKEPLRNTNKQRGQRERERERERERQTDRQTERKSETQIEKQRDGW
jgi:hypothetical protein